MNSVQAIDVVQKSLYKPNPLFAKTRAKFFTGIVCTEHTLCPCNGLANRTGFDKILTVSLDCLSNTKAAREICELPVQVVH